MFNHKTSGRFVPLGARLSETSPPVFIWMARGAIANPILQANKSDRWLLAEFQTPFFSPPTLADKSYF